MERDDWYYAVASSQAALVEKYQSINPDDMDWADSIIYRTNLETLRRYHDDT